VAAVVARAYADPAFMGELEELVAELAPAGRVKAAALALLRITSPGIPDTYQGTETEQLVLVDPDNRVPVTFEGDNSLKFQVTRTALRLRRDHPDLFTGYRPLDAPHNLVAFTRGDDHLVVVATRFPGAVRSATAAGPDGASGPVGLPAGPWRDLLSGARHPGGPTPAGQLLATLPHALLVRA
jgi:(1->4)-alpha-D-glucan 1-alpha-D-glucosylmutase